MLLPVFTLSVQQVLIDREKEQMNRIFSRVRNVTERERERREKKRPIENVHQSENERYFLSLSSPIGKA